MKTIIYALPVIVFLVIAPLFGGVHAQAQTGAVEGSVGFVAPGQGQPIPIPYVGVHHQDYGIHGLCNLANFNSYTAPSFAGGECFRANVGGLVYTQGNVTSGGWPVKGVTSKGQYLFSDDARFNGEEYENGGGTQNVYVGWIGDENSDVDGDGQVDLNAQYGGFMCSEAYHRWTPFFHREIIAPGASSRPLGVNDFFSANYTSGWNLNADDLFLGGAFSVAPDIDNIPFPGGTGQLDNSTVIHSNQTCLDSGLSQADCTALGGWTLRGPNLADVWSGSTIPDKQLGWGSYYIWHSADNGFTVTGADFLFEPQEQPKTVACSGASNVPGIDSCDENEVITVTMSIDSSNVSTITSTYTYDPTLLNFTGPASCSPNGTVITCTTPAAGATTSIDLTFTPICFSSFDTIVLMSGIIGDLGNNEVETHATDNCRTPISVDIELTSGIVCDDKVANTVDNAGLVTPSEVYSYTISYSNGGDAPLTNIKVSDRLPSGITFDTNNTAGCTVDAQGSQGDTQLVVCDVPDLGPQPASGEVTFNVLVDANAQPGTYSNVVESITADTDEGESSTPVGTTNPQNCGYDVVIQGDEDTTDIACTEKVVVDAANVTPVEAGDSFVFDVEYQNNGTTPVTGVIITDTLSQYLTFDAANSDASCTADSTNPGAIVTCILDLSATPLTTGQSDTVSIGVTVIDPLPESVTSISNAATVDLDNDNDGTPDSDDDNPNNNDCEVPVPVDTPVVEAVNVTCGGKGASQSAGVQIGDQVTYTVHYAVDTAGTDVRITDTIPTGMTLDTSTLGVCTSSTGTTSQQIDCLIEDVDPPVAPDTMSGFISYTVTVNVGGQTFENTATVEAIDDDGVTVLDSDSCSETIPSVQGEDEAWSIIKDSDVVGTASINDTVLYTILVTNESTQEDVLTSLVDTLDPKVDMTTVRDIEQCDSAGNGCTSYNVADVINASQRTITWPGSTYAGGETKMYRYKITVKLEGTYYNIAVATSQSGTQVQDDEIYSTPTTLPETGILENGIQTAAIAVGLIALGMVLFYMTGGTPNILVSKKQRMKDKLESEF